MRERPYQCFTMFKSVWAEDVLNVMHTLWCQYRSKFSQGNFWIAVPYIVSVFHLKYSICNIIAFTIKIGCINIELIKCLSSQSNSKKLVKLFSDYNIKLNPSKYLRYKIKRFLIELRTCTKQKLKSILQ